MEKYREKKRQMALGECFKSDCEIDWRPDGDFRRRGFPAYVSNSEMKQKHGAGRFIVLGVYEDPDGLRLEIRTRQGLVRIGAWRFYKVL